MILCSVKHIGLQTEEPEKKSVVTSTRWDSSDANMGLSTAVVDSPGLQEDETTSLDYATLYDGADLELELISYDPSELQLSIDPV